MPKPMSDYQKGRRYARNGKPAPEGASTDFMKGYNARSYKPRQPKGEGGPINGKTPESPSVPGVPSVPGDGISSLVAETGTPQAPAQPAVAVQTPPAMLASDPVANPLQPGPDLSPVLAGGVPAPQTPPICYEHAHQEIKCSIAGCESTVHERIGENEAEQIARAIPPMIARLLGCESPPPVSDEEVKAIGYCLGETSQAYGIPGKGGSTAGVILATFAVNYRGRIREQLAKEKKPRVTKEMVREAAKAANKEQVSASDFIHDPAFAPAPTKKADAPMPPPPDPDDNRFNGRVTRAL